MDEATTPRPRSRFGALKIMLLTAALLAVLVHFFYGSLPPLLQEHLTFLK
ncbi:MAG TPA: hypothetical protein VKF62_02050 [Planctomycetota bacterium]|nr:hypothetical protein [Planctomycetota bacterium]